MSDGVVRILVIDDDRFSFEILESYLPEIPARITLFWKESYEEGLEALLSGDFELCLLDFRLGERSGLELLREAQARGCRTPVVMLTGQGDRELDLEAMRAGAADYLVKGEGGPALLERCIRYSLDRTRTLERLRESEERFALAVRGSSDGLWDWKPKSQQLYLSPRWKDLLGFTDEELPNRLESWLDRVHADDLPALRAELASHVEGRAESFQNEHRILHKDENYRWVLCRAVAVRGSDGQATRVAGSMTDVTNSRARDPLTELPNRLLYLDRLGRALERLRRQPDYTFAVLLLDLDRFKLVNDSLGPAAGDELLVGIARRLERCMRAADTMARLGGDEFTFLLDDVKSAEGATRVAERLLRALATPFRVGDRDVFTAGSIGIALSRTGYTRPEEMLRDADTAMFRAKASGRNRHALFDEGMHQRAMHQLELEVELRKAVQAGQLRLHYQPIHSLRGGSLLGFEVLVRWAHPERGLLGPDHFIPLAEENGLVVEIDRWVLREACTTVKGWQEQFPMDPPLFVAANTSRRAFERADCIDQVRKAIGESNISPETVALEVTESVVMDETAPASANLGRLRAQGLHLVVDDFGTGYSSISFLHRLPFTGLKIDRSFVSRMLDGERTEEVVRAIVSLAKSFELSVTAEGVETAEQLARLTELGCDRAQGYFLGRPMEKLVAAELVAKEAAARRRNAS